MRPLFHPTMDDITVEGILHALSDPVRVQIFAQIAQAQCPQTCSTFLALSDRTVPKSTLSQHFKALREAGLIFSERKGVEMHNSPRCDAVEQHFPGLLTAIIEAHKSQTLRQRQRQQTSSAQAQTA